MEKIQFVGINVSNPVATGATILDGFWLTCPFRLVIYVNF